MAATSTKRGGLGLRAVLRAAVVLVAVCGASVLAISTSAHGTSPAPTPTVTTTTATLAVSALPTGDARELLLDVYTRGPLLDIVQRASLFPDSKHFVDMPIKANSSASVLLSEFHQAVQPALLKDPESSNATLLAFLQKHFDEPGSEIQKTIPGDFAESPVPPLIAAIQNKAYKHWALALHSLWKELGRSPSRTVTSSYIQPKPLASLSDTSTSTLIVVPGGRFRESYYWDSYWIVKGLMVSNMRATARRVVQNLLEYVAEFGFVPNGGRIYYLNRSQPPFLSDMVRVVATTDTQGLTQGQGNANATAWDLDYLRAVVPLLEKEHAYWMTHHRIDLPVRGETVQLNLYNVTVGSPRPESYREDVRLAETFFPSDLDRQQTLYDDLRASAESGWDFSSRWFKDHATLATIVTNDVVPVDLNAIMYRFESNVALFHTLLGNADAAARFTQAAATRAHAIELVFWDEASASWRDVMVNNGTDRSPVNATSNYSPLWGGAFRDVNMSEAALAKRLDRVVQSLRDSGLIQVAGVQSTTYNTTQQWDAPNAWPPLQDLLVEGLLVADTKNSRALAQELVRTWIKTTFAAWNQTGLMFEKYNATVVGGLGTGGEYEPQFGFGWSNGVVLKFLTEYADLLQ